MAGGLKDTIKKMVGQLELMQNKAIMKNNIRQTVTAYMILWKTKLFQYMMQKMKMECLNNGLI